MTRGTITIATRANPTRRELLVSSPHGDTVLFWEIMGAPWEETPRIRPLDDGLIAVLPMAVERGWDIEVAGPVSLDQLANAMELIDFLATTKPATSHRVHILANDVLNDDVRGWPQSVAFAFDGGIASTYAALTTRERLDRIGPSTEPDPRLVAVTAVPRGLANGEAPTVEPTHPILVELGIPQVRVVTNWFDLDPGCDDHLGLWRAAVMHQLSGSVDGAMVPSEDSYVEERHGRGQDSRVDHLAFNQSFPFVTSGRSIPYLEKVRTIASRTTVRTHLNVCRVRAGGSNCRTCPDCVRAALAMAYFGYPATPALGPVRDLPRPINVGTELHPLTLSTLVSSSGLLAPSLKEELALGADPGQPAVHGRLTVKTDAPAPGEGDEVVASMHTVWKKRLDDLSGHVTDAIRSALRSAEEVAFVNYPDIDNVGDPLLWMGAREALDSLGVRVVYSCDHRSYDPSRIADLPGNVPILVNGGGNFGDVWEGQHRVRIDLFERFTDRRIVQLPQSIFYRDPSRARRDAEIIARHPDHTMMWREELSRSRAQSLMGDAGMLVPDTAFAASLPFSPSKGGGVQWILRSDQESIVGRVEAPQGHTVTDWLSDPMPPASGLEVLRASLRIAEAQSGDAEAIDDLRRTIASMRIRRGAAILRRGSATVTDRLHGLILSVLCGIPVVALDNESGKVRGVAAYSLGSLPFVETSDDPATAARIGERFSSSVSDERMGSKTIATR